MLSAFPELAESDILMIGTRDTWKNLERALIKRNFPFRADDRYGELSSREFAAQARLQVVGSVLEEFELVGFVPEMTGNEVVTLELTAEQRAFIVEALRAIEIVDDPATRRSGKDRSFNAFVEELDDRSSESWTVDRVQGFIARKLNDLPVRLERPLFEAWEQGSGPGTKSQRKARFDDLYDGLRKLAMAARLDTEAPEPAPTAKKSNKMR